MIHPAIIPESSIRRNRINQFGGLKKPAPMQVARPAGTIPGRFQDMLLLSCDQNMGPSWNHHFYKSNYDKEKTS
jgi:hypothetical protein